MRVKTEKEMKKEFGRNWRNKVECSFPKAMDYLLGQTLPPSKAKVLKKFPWVTIRSQMEGSWSISRDMTTEE
jgi:hypothetical protein